MGQIPKYIIDDIEISSYSDRENSDEKSSNEENSDKETPDEKIQMKKIREYLKNSFFYT